MKRIGLVVHPTREIDRAIATLREWAEAHGIEVVQVQARDAMRVVAPAGEVEACDLVVALGGDGTVLTALRTAMETATPVLGVACGSLGALSAVQAPHLVEALDKFEAGEWFRRDMHALETRVDGSPVAWAINDFVLVRRSGGQLIVEVTVGGELYARMAGDGVVVATALGSSAYSMAAGGPVLVTGTAAFVVTPLVIHGGSIPPLVVRGSSTVVLEAHPGWGGMQLEVDGQTAEVSGTRLSLRLVPERATLVLVSDPGLGLAPLRARGLIADSPRARIREARGAPLPDA